MLGKDNEFAGFVLEDDAIKVARLRVVGKKLQLVKLDRFSLVEEIKNATQKQETFNESQSFGLQDADSVFGLDDDGLSESEAGKEEEEIDFEALEAEAAENDLLSLDMVDEVEGVQSNEILLYNILSDLSTIRVRLGINIPAGNTIFQIIRDTNFKEVKEKDLITDLEDKLESIYGVSKSSDNYAYQIREDGSLILASTDDVSPLLQLLDRARDFYNGKVIVEEILPDEAILVGLVRANYELIENEITGVLQFGPHNCRITFMKGTEIWQVSPIINEGTKNKTFLNTVFSKILFQLDTGEVPSLDRIIIANNTLGQSSIDFFQQNFADISVDEFQFDKNKFDFGELDPATGKGFITAIGMAWAAAGTYTDRFPQLSLLPTYVADRQKIFKLQWHGVLLLLLIFISPLTFNYFYQSNSREIASLSSELQQVNGQITQLTPIVDTTNELTNNLSLLKNKLVLLDTLSKGSREWSSKLGILDSGFRRIHSTWLTSLSSSQKGTVLEGYTLYRQRIPEVVNIFKEATLLNVNIEEMREKEVFRFSILVKEFANDESIYSLPKPKEIQTIIQ